MTVESDYYLPEDGGWHGVIHVLVADVAHLPGEQVVDLDRTVAFRRRNVLVVVIKTDAVGGHIDGAEGDLWLDPELRTLRVLIAVAKRQGQS